MKGLQTSKIIVLVTLALSVAIGSSCSSLDDGGLLLGDVRGVIHLLPEQNGLNLTPAQILIPSIKFSAFADSTGEWVLHNVPFGVYNVLITSQGNDSLQYDTLPYFGVISSGGTTVLPEGYLSPNPRGIVEIDSILWPDQPEFNFNIIVNGSTSTSHTAVFLDTVPDVPIKGLHFCDPILGKSSTFADIGGYRLKHGAKLYFTACLVADCGIGPSYGESRYNPEISQEQVIAHGPLSKPHVTNYP